MEQNYLPKNIRQIGQIVKEPKIYIEDYVIAFARKLAEKSKNGQGMAVLLGEEHTDNEKEPVFIRGAVEIVGWEENNGVLFDNEIWSNIYEGVKNYFPDLGIAGWLVVRSGQETGFDEKIKAIHESNFIENGNILFVFDKEEKEENVYQYENLKFEKQAGYYIYYEKNEAMQNYMIDTFGNKSQETTGEDKVMEQVRELVSNKENNTGKKANHFVYAASTALAAVVLVIGVTTLNNYDKMENMEKTLNHISANIEEQGSAKSYSEASESELVVETITGTVEGVIKEEEVEENAMTSETGNTEATVSESRYYIVQKGDTLGSISGAVYGSTEYVDAIQEANEIDNKDMIYEGQKLIMP